MADISTNMKVTGISQYKSALSQAQASVKQLDAALKRNEAQFKVTGDQEQYMADKARLLKMRMDSQKAAAQQAQAALKKMDEQGVSKVSTAYQNMLTKLTEAQTGMLNTKTEMDNLTKSEKEAKDGADQLTESVKGISKKVSLEQVVNAVGKISNGLKSAAQSAVRVGKAIARSAMDSTEWADDVLTRATQYGTDAETIQRMDNLAAYIDTDVDTILGARDKLMTGVGRGNKGTMDALEFLGLKYNGDAEDTFWRAGEAIMNLSDEADRDAKAMDLFGKSWRELVPLFTAGQEEYNRRMGDMNVLTNEQVEKLGEADDAFKSVQQQVQNLKNEFWAEHSDTVINLLQWLVDNKDSVVTALEAIGIAFGALKVSEGVLTFVQLISGLKGLTGGAGAAGAAGAAAKTAAGGAAATGGGSFVSKIAAGASSPFAVLAGAEAAMAYVGAKMIEANLNDENLNAVYGGNGGEGGLIETMSDEAVKAAMEYWNVYQETGSEAAFDARDKLQAALESQGFYNDEQGVGLIEQVFDNMLNETDPDGLGAKLQERFKEQDFEITAEPIIDEESLQAQAAGITVKVGAELVPTDMSSGGPDGYANGIWSVPYNGFPAILHKGERVVPAREVNNSSYNSNLYVEKMYMNNGTDAQGLAAAMAAAQRRRMSGYGS